MPMFLFVLFLGYVPSTTGCQHPSCSSGILFDDCIDSISNCAAYGQQICSDQRYTAWVQQNCCAYCSNGSSSAIVTNVATGILFDDCIDSIINCAAYGQHVCSDQRYTAWVQQNCCAYCSNGSAIVTNVATGCEYKGLQFHQGQNWTSVCQSDCVCEDTASGRYQCRESCSTYDHLPSFCWFVNNTAECCAATKCYFATPIAVSGERFTKTSVTRGISVSGTHACVNKVTNCGSYPKELCSNAAYRTWANTYCCAFCKNGKTDLPIGVFSGKGDSPTFSNDQNLAMHDCEDKANGDCDSSRQFCDNATFASWAANSCPKTCNKCKTTGGCLDGGRAYIQLQTWYRECVSQCMCLDDVTGEYQCTFPCVQQQQSSACQMSPLCPAGFNLKYPQHWSRHFTQS